MELATSCMQVGGCYVQTAEEGGVWQWSVIDYDSSQMWKSQKQQLCLLFVVGCVHKVPSQLAVNQQASLAEHMTGNDAT